MLQVGEAIPCRDGICFPSTLQALDHLEDVLDTMSPRGARYGQFTRVGATSSQAASVPPLAQPFAGAWYWIEAFRYETGADTLAPHRHVQPDPSRPFVYRITAVAHGLKPGTRTVIKSLFVPYPSEQLQ
jgi:type IV pilus assembly protein PilX